MRRVWAGPRVFGHQHTPSVIDFHTTVESRIIFPGLAQMERVKARRTPGASLPSEQRAGMREIHAGMDSLSQTVRAGLQSTLRQCGMHGSFHEVTARGRFGRAEGKGKVATAVGTCVATRRSPNGKFRPALGAALIVGVGYPFCLAARDFDTFPVPSGHGAGRAWSCRCEGCTMSIRTCSSMRANA